VEKLVLGDAVFEALQHGLFHLKLATAPFGLTLHCQCAATVRWFGPKLQPWAEQKLEPTSITPGASRRKNGQRSRLPVRS